MANRRMIASDVFEDEFVGTLNFLERLLWIGLITTVADDQGRMMDNPALIRSKVFLFDKVNDEEIEVALRKIYNGGKIERYVSSNKSLIQIINWWKYQTPAWASPSKYPPPDNWTDRAKYHAAGNKIVTCNWDKIGGYVAGYVAGLHSAIEDGNGKGEVKGEGDGEVHDAYFSANPLSVAFEKASNILAPGNDAQKWIEACEKMQALNITPSEVSQAVFELNKKHYTIIGPSSIVTAAINLHGKGKSNGNGDHAGMTLYTGPNGEEIWK